MMWRDALKAFAFVPLYDEVRTRVDETVMELQARADMYVERARRKITRSITQTALMLAGAGFVIAAILIFLMRFFPADAVLLVAGLLVLYIAWMMSIMRR